MFDLRDEGLHDGAREIGVLDTLSRARLGGVLGLRVYDETHQPAEQQAEFLAERLVYCLVAKC
jgi:hypothetical protein